MRKKFLQLVSGNLLNTILTGVLGIYLANVLGPENKGILTIIMSSIMLLSMLIGLGTPHSAAYFIRNKPNSVKKILFYTNIVTILGIIFSFLLLLGTEQSFKQFILGGYEFDLIIQIVIAGLTAVGTSNAILGACIIAKGETKSFARSANIGTVNTILFIVAFMYLNLLNIKSALLSYFIGQLITTIMLRVTFQKFIQENYEVTNEELSNLPYKEYFGYGLKTQIGVLASLIFKRIDLFIIGYFLDTRAVGYYSVGLSLRDMALIIPRALAGIVGGEIAGKNDLQYKSLLLRKSLLICFLISVGVVIASYLVFPIIIPLFFGVEYTESITFSRIIMISTIPLAMAIVVNVAIGSSGKPFLMSLSNLISSIVGFLCIWFLTIHYKLIGTAWSTVVSCLVLFLINFIIFRWFIEKREQSI